jgi:hypothetical protein
LRDFGALAQQYKPRTGPEQVESGARTKEGLEAVEFGGVEQCDLHHLIGVKNFLHRVWLL